MRLSEAQIVVRATRILLTNRVIITAWERSADDGFPPFGTITTFDVSDDPRGYAWFGKIGTSHLPKEIDALPRGEQRITSFHNFRENEYRRAYREIMGRIWCLVEFRAADRVEDSGEIVVECGDTVVANALVAAVESAGGAS